MIYQEKYFYVCRIPLSAEGPQDVEIVTKTSNIEDFPRIFEEYEELRKHAFNKDGLFSIIRADEIIHLLRTSTPAAAKEEAFENCRANLITNLQHRVMQEKDENARAILQSVHEVSTNI